MLCFIAKQVRGRDGDCQGVGGGHQKIGISEFFTSFLNIY